MVNFIDTTSVSPFTVPSLQSAHIGTRPPQHTDTYIPWHSQCPYRSSLTLRESELASLDGSLAHAAQQLREAEARVEEAAREVRGSEGEGEGER